MFGRIIKHICWLNNRSNGRKSKRWKQFVAGVIYRSTSLFIGLAIRLVSLARPDPVLIDIAVSKVPVDGRSLKDIADELTNRVNGGIEYWPIDRWLHPSHILRLGIGDCKNQASLLQAMFKSCGIKSELVVGLTNKFSHVPGIHAWVRVEIDGSSFVCDPIVSNKTMDTAEYESVVKGLIDVTPEYLLKEPISAIFGVGKFSYPQ